MADKAFRCPNCKQINSTLILSGEMIPEQHKGRHSQVQLLSTLNFYLRIGDSGEISVMPIYTRSEDERLLEWFDWSPLARPKTIIRNYVRTVIENQDVLGTCRGCGADIYMRHAVVSNSENAISEESSEASTNEMDEDAALSALMHEEDDE